MLIAAAPVAVPVTTANPPTEAVAAEAAQKTPIPEAKSTTDSAKSRNPTESAEQQRNPVDQNNQTGQRDRVERDGEQGQRQDSQNQDSRNQDSQNQQEQNQQNREQARQEQLEQREIDQLKSVDAEVKAHERAHAAVGGQYAGAPSYTYTTGPDGKRYAVAGEVPIDVSSVPGNPQATIDKMQQVQRAALAPAEPSAQDTRVAAIAGQVANQARVELAIERREEVQAQLDSSSNENGTVGSGDNESANVNAVANPVAARRASILLNQRIADSGALDDADQEPLFSQTA